MTLFIRGFALPVVALLVSTAPALADVIDVQFSGTVSFCGGCLVPNPPQVGAAVIGRAGDTWNDFAATSAGNQALVNSLNQDSGGVTLSFSADVAYRADPGFDAFNSTQWANLMEGYLVDHGGGITISLAGLAAGKQYGLYVYTQGDNNSTGRAISLTVNGITEIATQTNADSFVLGDNYLYFDAPANDAGQINITGATVNSEGNVNGLQLLTSVPEPASVLLLSMGLIGLAAIRRGHVPAGR